MKISKNQKIVIQKYNLLSIEKSEEFNKRKEDLQENKTKAFYIIMGQCLPAIKNKIKRLDKYEDLEDKDNIIGLFKKYARLLFKQIII